MASTAPWFFAAGQGSNTNGNTPLTPAWPDGVQPYQLAVMVGYAKATTAATGMLSASSDWTLIATTTVGTVDRFFVWSRVASSTMGSGDQETITRSVSTAGANAGYITVFSAQSHKLGYESTVVQNVNATTDVWFDADVATLGNNRLALNIWAFTGAESSSTTVLPSGWTTLSAFCSTTVPFGMFIAGQTASTAQTVGGGSVTASTKSPVFATIGLAIFADPYSLAKVSGYATSRNNRFFDAIQGSARTIASSDFLASTSFLIESSAGVFSGPANRSVRIQNTSTNQFYVKFGSSDVVATSSNSMMIPPLCTETCYVSAGQTYMAFSASTAASASVVVGKSLGLTSFALK